MSASPPFAVAAGHRLTAEAAADVLRGGGNAADAAIAGALTACVAEPVFASLFGGGFMMVRPPRGGGKLLDFFVQTPRAKARPADLDLRAVEADFGETRQRFHIGAGAIGAPGVAAGLAEAHARLGHMPFAEIAGPAIRAAKEGVTLTAFQARVLHIVSPIFTATPEARALFCTPPPESAPPPASDAPALKDEGDVIRNPALADVLETFAREGVRFMQEGEAAQALLSLEGGHLTALDLKRYEARWREPLTETRPTDRGAMTLALNPPPALGGALIAFALRLIEPGDGPVDIAGALAAAARGRIEAALDEDAAAGALKLLPPDLLARYAKDLAGARAASRGTTHISVIDGAGLGAALTLSNGSGGGLIAPGTGLMPNNMLGEEDLTGPDLDWPEDRRLASMMAPLALEWPDGRAAMLGSGGSSRIRSALTQVVAHIAEGAGLEAAITAPRLHIEGDGVESGGEGGGRPDFEDFLRDDRRAALLRAWPEARPWAERSMFFGGVHAVIRDVKGGVDAAADPRRDGVAIMG